MTTLWVSIALTFALMGVTVPLGGVALFTYASAVLLLPHIFIGDLFHWSRFPRLSGSEKATWLTLAAVGFCLFLLFRQAGTYGLPLFFVYLFAHFWKDLDLCIGPELDDRSASELRRPKRWCGALALPAVAILSSGLVTDPQVISLATQVAGHASVVLLGFALLHLARARADHRPIDFLWADYAGLTGCVLFACAWLNSLHPSGQLVVRFFIVLHFMLWYVFYWSAVRRSAAAGAGRPRRGLERLKHSLPELTAFIISVNVVAAAGAWLYGTSPQFGWLKYVYNINYLVGCWTIMHVTWDWLPKEIKGVRLSVL